MEALERDYFDYERDGSFPLAVHRTAIEELCSLITAVFVLIKDSQWTGGQIGLSMCIDLCVLQRRPAGAYQATHHPDSDRQHSDINARTPPPKRPPATLHKVTTATTGRLLEALNKRCSDKRYNEEATAYAEPGCVLEVATSMPPLPTQAPKPKWFGDLCNSEEEAGRVQCRVWDNSIHGDHG